MNIQITNYFIYSQQIFAMHKNIILIVDNRTQEQHAIDHNKSHFRGSAFKATQVDPLENNEISADADDDQAYLAHLQKRIVALEERIKTLERSSKDDKLKRRIRRKASQISREFQCHHKDCQKLYGSQTSLKNHLKLKHGQRDQKIGSIDC